MAGSVCSVGILVSIIVGDIVYNIRVADLIFTVPMRHRNLGILDKAFLEFMQHWIIGKLIIEHLLSIWKVIFAIKLFLF